ncbi:hypothetical protein [uncultured Shimia sp.]|uniref:hypothetical protein n=1 Tax=uncultured Shimia sp. TaxID=573152 RepID=UPI002601FDB2|nr:hypothetical protein [uncultured Shimia sp.]
MSEMFSVRERDDYFRHTSRNEAVIRFVGLVILLGAFVQWLTPDANFAGDPHVTKVGMSIAFSMVGLALYTYTMRGHRIEIRFDPSKHVLSVAKLDQRDRTRSIRNIPLRNIKSIYVLRAEVAGAPSKMRIKLYDNPTEQTVLRGSYDEVELAHRQLCRSIKLAQA